MEPEVETLLRKEAIEMVPPQDRESGLYSRYFIVPKKDGGLRPILDLRQLDHSVMWLKFRMLTVSQVVLQIRKFLRFAFRDKAYQYWVLPFGLALSPRTFTKCVDAVLAPLRLRGIRILNYIDDWLILAQLEHMAVQHRDVVLAHMKELGLRLNAKKSVLSPLQRTTYLGMVSPGAGCHGTGVAEALFVRLSPDRTAPGSSGESVLSSFSCPVLAGPSLVLGPDFPSQWLSMGDSHQEGPPFSGGGHHPPPSPGVVEVMGVAPEGNYALKWRLFTSWCGHHQQDPVGTVLEYLQIRFSAGLAHSILRVCVAAISAYHAPLGGMSVGKDPLVVRFLHGALRLRPPVRPRVPTWDLAMVLEALCRPPIDPIEESSNHHLSTRTVLLLALTSLKRVGDLQALSVAPSHLDFAPGMAKAFLYPRSWYVPKVPSTAPWPIVLQAFCPPPFRDSDQQKLNCMCPVRALDTGLPASKQTLSRWIVDAITQAYESSGLPSPLGDKAHSTRGISASKAFMSGVPTQGICNAAGWSMPLTFVRFYDLDLRVAPGSSVLFGLAHTLGRDLELWGHGHIVPHSVSTQLEFLKGNVPGYDCNLASLKGTRRCISSHTSCIPVSVRFFCKMNAGSGARAL
ncbi:Transposon Ty3-G Gag-Pol polyprotein [Labeo rohita]|uniref:ribonuclease H n=1 Tax=Labeo rohita TaxID=84645 RepID=A0ABQ8LEF7_LABRO|nr:Transposon Ty3-G Gag-Pol polyprotein [Labeo rohita]